MKKILSISILCVLGFCINGQAHDKAVVIPLFGQGTTKVAGTDKQVQYNNNGTLSGADIYYENTTGSVGIATNAPDADHKLHVNGLARFDLGLGSIRMSTPGGWPGLITFAPNGNRRDIQVSDWGISIAASTTSLLPDPNNGIVIQENGNVGIGVTDPTGKLEVAGGDNLNALYASSSAGGGFAAGYFSATGGGTYGIWTNSGSYVGLRAESGSGTALEAVTSSGHAATFSGGNVGIGTSNPVTMLEVSSVIRSTPTDTPGTCNAATEGAMYYDESLHEPCFCNGAGWFQFDGDGGC